MKKKVIIISGGILVLFAVYNIFWYYTTHELYSQFKTGMEKMEAFTYCSHDSENFGYLVGYPSYLHFNTGCLSITSADHESSLIIWPQYNGKEFEYGVRVSYLGEKYEIKMTEDGNAIDPYEQKIVDSNKEVIEKLYQKAEKKWGF